MVAAMSFLNANPLVEPYCPGNADRILRVVNIDRNIKSGYASTNSGNRLAMSHGLSGVEMRVWEIGRVMHLARQRAFR
jgi:hypothetical protein